MKRGVLVSLLEVLYIHCYVGFIECQQSLLYGRLAWLDVSFLLLVN